MPVCVHICFNWCLFVFDVCVILHERVYASENFTMNTSNDAVFPISVNYGRNSWAHDLNANQSTNWTFTLLYIHSFSFNGVLLFICFSKLFAELIFFLDAFKHKSTTHNILTHFLFWSWFNFVIFHDCWTFIHNSLFFFFVELIDCIVIHSISQVNFTVFV